MIADQLQQRGMPASLDAERSILGAILLDNQAWSEAAEQLVSYDFYLDSHRKLYARMAELVDGGRPVDIVTLTEQLAQHKEIESTGGVAYISSLTDGLPRRPSIAQYVRIVKDKAMLRALVHACNAASARALDQGEDAAEIVAAAEAQIYAVAQHRIRQSFSLPGEIVRDHFGSLDALCDPDKRPGALMTGFERFDELTSGLQKQDLIIVAARPSMGKTAFAMNIAARAAVEERKVVGVFSLETSKPSLIQRELCALARVDSQRLRSGFLTREDRQKLIDALTRMVDAPLYIDDTPGITLTEMRAKARRLQQQAGRLDLIVVDYLQLMNGLKPDGRSHENRTQEVSALSRGLKALAKEMDVPVLALSQLSRAPEKRQDTRPQLADLRESGTIEQDADVVAFLWREEYYLRDDCPPEKQGVAEVILAKQRNGPTGLVKLAWLKNYTRFENIYDPQTSARGANA